MQKSLLNSRRRLAAFGLALILVLPGLAACSDNEETQVDRAAYGTYGSDFARQYAARFPNRSAGSEQETDAGDYLIEAFESMGYKPIVTTFTFSDVNGNTLTSRNIAVLIEGSGFSRTSTSGKTTNFERQVIIGAHYDTMVTAEQAAEAAAATSATETAATEATGETTTGETDVVIPTLADCDGIQDNASGVAALMTIAREMSDYQYGYDVVLVAFGAGTANQAGSRYFAAQMGEEEIARTDAMYCLDSIYAGDKVYAHAGRNSIVGGNQKNYEMRRKLYEVTDVFYENELYTNNRYMLYTNQSSVMVDVEGLAEKAIYREWSFNVSDYQPFDALNVPIVFFESFDYDKESVEQMKESQNPAFGTTNGMIRGTYFDTSAYLDQLLDSTSGAATAGSDETSAASIDLLTKRVNNTAFIILEAVNKGVHDAVKR